MSTKNLARTILEAGSTNYGKYERHHSKKKERAQTRAYLTKVAHDPEYSERVVTPKRGPGYKSPDDNLGAVYRFVESWVGRSWNKCYSEMKRKFNPKSLAGYHIIHDHILRDIYKNEDELRARPYWRTRYNEYYVDDQGILRKMERAQYDGIGPITSWLGNRKIALLGNNYYWFVYTKGSCQWKNLEEVGHVYESEGFVNGFQPAVKAADKWVPACGRFRQDRRLNEKELEYFENEVSYTLRPMILTQAPAEIDERKRGYWEERARAKSAATENYRQTKDLPDYYIY